MSGTELINKQEFFASLAIINKEWEECKEFLAHPKQIQTLTEFLRNEIKPLGLAFTGRGFGKGLLVFVDTKEAAGSYEGLIHGYFKKNEDSIMMFDELERQVVLSSLAPGACLIDCAHELWYY